MEKEKMYPPRLTVEACGSSATESSVACMRFNGSCEDEELYTEVSLPHHVTSGKYGAVLIEGSVIFKSVLQHFQPLRLNVLTVLALHHQWEEDMLQVGLGMKGTTTLKVSLNYCEQTYK